MPEAFEPQLDELRRRARRRLVGAIVLALAAAVLVPMLLESEPKPLGEDVSVRIPPVDEGKFVSRLGDKPMAGAPATGAGRSATEATPPKDMPSTQSGAPPSAKPGPAQPVAPGARPAGDAGDAAGRVASPASGPKPEPVVSAAPASSAAKPAAAPVGDLGKSGTTSDAGQPGSGSDAGKSGSTSVAPKANSYSVQLAAFADDKGANALAGRLKKAGHPAYTEPYTTSRGTLWRVRVGPYPSRDAAEAARAKLKADGQSGIIAQAD